MIRKGTRIYSILHKKCPRCQEGNLFISGAYTKKFMEMPSKCPVCQLNYEPEPAFYTGAMYVSYALQVALFTTIYVALRVLFNPAMEVYFIAMIGIPVVLAPVTLRLSRAIYINFFFSYDPEWIKTTANHDGTVAAQKN
ncbi:MAG: DUF983 domain-containing protein [Cyclobacteriaceae bacterium]|nr:DUF983 domain-containing protein [Cyclobacteriaceae bacterium]MCX7637386.1 DUF983 domain-containing protein [Cyclobacteriaceae bacterium]MDW8330086.1 DUF983 domain-containing protein [Cyclobacteriaceae bacterium]